MLEIHIVLYEKLACSSLRITNVVIRNHCRRLNFFFFPKPTDFIHCLLERQKAAELWRALLKVNLSLCQNFGCCVGCKTPSYLPRYKFYQWNKLSSQYKNRLLSKINFQKLRNDFLQLSPSFRRSIHDALLEDIHQLIS